MDISDDWSPGVRQDVNSLPVDFEPNSKDKKYPSTVFFNMLAQNGVMDLGQSPSHQILCNNVINSAICKMEMI